MFAPRLLFVLFLATLLRLSAAELTEGISRAELESLVGRPVSVLQRGDKTVLIYPKKGRAEFLAGRLVYFERIEVLDTPASPPAAKAPAVPVQTSASLAPVPSGAATTAAAPGAVRSASAGKAVLDAAQPSAQTKVPSTDAPAVQTSTPEGLPQLSPAQLARIEKQEAELNKIREKMLHADAVRPIGSSDRAADSDDTNPWLVMLIQSLFKIPITVVVLKLAFKWSDVDADWSQMWLPAAVDTIVRFSVQALAQSVWGIDMLFYVDEALAFFALLYTLIKTTHACTMVRAIGVAFAAKLASIVVWAILSVFILGLLFSRSHL